MQCPCHNDSIDSTINVCISVSIFIITTYLCIVIQEYNCAYVILIMAIYWMTEALPMAVTALLPVVLMLYHDVIGSKDLAVNYFKVCTAL